LSEKSLSGLTAIVPGGLGLAGARVPPFCIFIGAKEVEAITGAIRRAKLQSNRHHHQTNTQLFTDQPHTLLTAHLVSEQHETGWK